MEKSDRARQQWIATLAGCAGLLALLLSARQAIAADREGRGGSRVSREADSLERLPLKFRGSAAAQSHGSPDRSVRQVSAEQPLDDGIPLPPRRSSSGGTKRYAGGEGTDAAASGGAGPQRSVRSSSAKAITTIFSSLALVIGVFLFLVWLVKRTHPKATAMLPRDVVEVFGRASITPRQSVHVVRFGSKILLLSVSPTGIQSLAEVDEPAEAERLIGLCQQAQPTSVTSSFRQILAQISNESTARGFVENTPASSRDAQRPANRRAAGAEHG
ncbi:MAG: FliO/MopB family protein [Planctomycetes bacterium]|nr:FliO/MopB family protein [Planctomycetota bacterium]